MQGSRAKVVKSGFHGLCTEVPGVWQAPAQRFSSYLSAVEGVGKGGWLGTLVGCWWPGPPAQEVFVAFCSGGGWAGWLETLFEIQFH